MRTSTFGKRRKIASAAMPSAKKSPTRNGQESLLEADPRHDPDAQLVADKACQQHDRHGIEEIGEHGGEDGDEQAPPPS